MKQLIKIDKTSIIKNKNAGDRSTVIKGNQHITFSGSGEIPNQLIDDDNFHITNIEYENDDVIHYSGVIDYFDDNIYFKLKEDKINIKVNINISNNIIHHEPISKYKYRFDDNTVITCDYCGEELTYGQLLEFDSDDYYNDKVCPHCGEHDCVQLRFEKIENVI